LLKSFQLFGLNLSVSLFSLKHNLFCLSNPLNILDECLLDFIVAHAPVKVLLEFDFFSAKFPNFLVDAIHFTGEFRHIITVQFAIIFKFRVFRLDLRNFLLDRSNNFVGWLQSFIYFASLLFFPFDFCLNLFNFLENGL